MHHRAVSDDKEEHKICFVFAKGHLLGRYIGFACFLYLHIHIHCVHFSIASADWLTK